MVAMDRAPPGSPGRKAGGGRAYEERGDLVSDDIRVTEKVQRGSVALDTGTRQPACIERPDFASGQPGQPDFNSIGLTRRPNSPLYVTGTLEGLGPVADVLVLEIHFLP